MTHSLCFISTRSDLATAATAAFFSLPLSLRLIGVRVDRKTVCRDPVSS
jgi:hypothetical protein